MLKTLPAYRCSSQGEEECLERLQNPSWPGQRSYALRSMKLGSLGFVKAGARLRISVAVWTCMEICPGIYLGCGGCPLGVGRMRLLAQKPKVNRIFRSSKALSSPPIEYAKCDLCNEVE